MISKEYANTLYHLTSAINQSGAQLEQKRVPEYIRGIRMAAYNIAIHCIGILSGKNTDSPITPFNHPSNIPETQPVSLGLLFQYNYTNGSPYCFNFSIDQATESLAIAFEPHPYKDTWTNRPVYIHQLNTTIHPHSLPIINLNMGEQYNSGRDYEGEFANEIASDRLGTIQFLIDSYRRKYKK